MEDVITRLKKLDTTSVSDALDRIEIPGGLYGIKPIEQEHKICGRAFTVHYVPCGLNKGTVGDFLDDVEPGEVVVIDNSGRDYCTVWGDIMTVVAKQMGIEGTVIDGVCRDIPGIKQHDYSIYTKGYYMKTGKDRVEVDGVNVPVSISGIQVKPGDIILGDDSGVVVIPQEVEEKVLEIAESIEKTEKLIIQEVVNGNSLKQSRANLNYHHLQTKETEE